MNKINIKQQINLLKIKNQNKNILLEVSKPRQSIDQGKAVHLSPASAFARHHAIFTLKHNLIHYTELCGCFHIWKYTIIATNMYMSKMLKLYMELQIR